MSLEAPALGISYAVQLDDKHGLTIQTHVDSTADKEVIDAMLDKIAAAIDRQTAAYQLPSLLREQAALMKFLERAQADIIAIDAKHQHEFEAKGRRGEFKLTPQQVGERGNAMTTIERAKDDYLKLTEQIAAVQKVVGHKE